MNPIEAKARQDRKQGYLRQASKEQAHVLWGLLSVPLVLAWIYCLNSEDFPLAAEIGLGIGTAAPLGWVLIKIRNIARLKILYDQETTDLPKEGMISVMMAPLTEELDPDIKKLLTVAQKEHYPLLEINNEFPLLLNGAGDLSGIPDDHNNSILESRYEAVKFVRRLLLDPQTKAAEPRSDLARTDVLKQLERILASPPSLEGLKITKHELNILTKIVAWGATLERAPETLTEYGELLEKQLESYILHQREPSAAQSISDTDLSAAIRAGCHSGRLVSPPLENYKFIRAQREREEARVIIDTDSPIELAKSLIAISQRRLPEARGKAEKAIGNLIPFYQHEKRRLERSNRNGQEDNYLAVINTVLKIFSLVFNGVFDQQKTIQLKNFFPGLRDKIKIMPRDIFEALEKTEFGNLKIEGDTISIIAKNIFLAEVLACSAAVSYPHIPRLEICIGEGNIAVKSILIATGEFYFQRLILKDGGFLDRKFSETEKQTPPVETQDFVQLPSSIS